MVTSTFDATYSVYKLTSAIDQLLFSGFGGVEITSVHSDGQITADQLIGTISEVKTSSSLDKVLRSRAVVDARPGSKITVEVTLEMPDGGSTVANLMVKAPRFGRGGIVKIRGGREDWYIRNPGSFERILRALSGGEHYDDLVVSGPGRKQVQQQPVVVDGKAFFRIRIVR